LAQPHPPEIAMPLDRLREKYPDPKKLGFLVMRFTAAKPFGKIVEIIKRVGEEHGLKIIRADENEFHADLWGNVRTHLHGCGFGIAVYERIETNEPNANIGLEVGYLMAMNKPVLLLKDKTVTILQADLAGKLYKEFDPHDPETTIPGQLTKWLEDYGIVIPKT
jgi:nucleoside 2-deoxyribosyltransferase